MEGWKDGRGEGWKGEGWILDVLGVFLKSGFTGLEEMEGWKGGRGILDVLGVFLNLSESGFTG